MSYPDKYPRDSFETHTSITHKPTGYKFVQQGGRITVLRLNGESGLYHPVADFTTSELQQFGVVLTEAQLIRAAITWLKDNVK